MHLDQPAPQLRALGLRVSGPRFRVSEGLGFRGLGCRG